MQTKRHKLTKRKAKMYKGGAEPDPEPKEPEPEEPVIEEERIKISEQKPITKRCKNGTRRNKKTGNCDPI